MSITVEDCMKLPSFGDAKLVAGKKGKSSPVNSITVLEYADVSLISSELFLNGEICITAFASIKNDVDTQCAVVRKMKSIGMAALVIYYIGIFVPRLDGRLVATANEVELPLFCMPVNRMDYRYGEMISDVMDAIYRSQHEDQNYVAAMLDSIALLPENLRTIRTVLRMISDRLRCSLFIIEQDGTMRSEGQWPISAHWDYQPLVELMQKKPRELAGVKKLQLGQKGVSASCVTLNLKRNASLMLLVIDDQGQITDSQVTQAADIITTFLNISDYSFQETTPEMLVRSIIEDDPLRMREIATQHNIDTSKYQAMWIVQEKRYSSAHISKQRLTGIMASTRAFFSEPKKRVLMDAYQNSIVLFFESAGSTEFNKSLAEAYQNSLGTTEHPLCLAMFSNLLTTKDARSAYELFVQYFDSLQALYLNRDIYTLHDLRFAEKCKMIIAQSGTALSNQLYAIEPLRQVKGYETLLETLAVYLLDADSNIQKAADLMFIHRNTLKYRMTQIREAYGADISKMPLAAALYEAVAINRLTKQ